MKIIAISQLFSAIFLKNLKITLSIKSILRMHSFYHRISAKADVRLEWSLTSARGGDGEWGVGGVGGVLGCGEAVEDGAECAVAGHAQEAVSDVFGPGAGGDGAPAVGAVIAEDDHTGVVTELAVGGDVGVLETEGLTDAVGVGHGSDDEVPVVVVGHAFVGGVFHEVFDGITGGVDAHRDHAELAFEFFGEHGVDMGHVFGGGGADTAAAGVDKSDEDLLIADHIAAEAHGLAAVVGHSHIRESVGDAFFQLGLVQQVGPLTGDLGADDGHLGGGGLEAQEAAEANR